MIPSEIQTLLPTVFQRTLYPGSPLSALLEIMADMHAPAETTLAHLDAVFDPHRTPDAFVPLLARWVNLDPVLDSTPSSPANSAAKQPLSTGLPPLRELIAIAATLSRWRGTAKGLILFLETATDTRGFEVTEHGTDTNRPPRPFHLTVRAPIAVQPHEPLIHRIIQFEKPAYVTYDLVFSQPPGG
ncbi:phage tail protein [Leptolyngbya sp. AN02str]|uniref:phage tail protein n=1 Tax=Leptolyngbya sp. AN02str TaxID=3423363 RepID=UPI003D319B91